MTDQPRTETRPSAMERFIGGHPLSVLLKLVFVSLLVGVAMNLFGITPQGLLRGGLTLLREALRDGVGLFRDLGFQIAAGAALVVPVWLLIRLSKKR